MLDASFHVYLSRGDAKTPADVSFVRQGILVSDVKSRAPNGVRALVAIDDGPLATFLGDAENPAHTKWQPENVRPKYSFHAATLGYVIDSVRELLIHTREDDAKPDPTVMQDLFHEPDPEPVTPKKPLPKGSGGKKDGPTPPPPPPTLPPPRPKSYTLSRTAGGFKVGRGADGAPRPTALTVLMAYDNGQSNPLRKYHPADFQLEEEGGLTIESVGLEITKYEGNRVEADMIADEFELVVTGFDENRDLYVDVRPAVPKPVTLEEDEDTANTFEEALNATAI